MAAKKDPYKRIQKRFVQAREPDVEYEDLDPERREQLQNRFNMLSQTVQGRGTIARRILGPDAPQERVKALRQRIRQNLPQSDGSSTPSEDATPPAGPTITNARLKPTSADIRNMQVGFRVQGERIEASRRAASAITTTVTTAKDKGSGRIGKGYFSVPKSPTEFAKEVGAGLMGQVSYVNRAYINPVINVGIAASNVLRSPGQKKTKSLPTLSNKEIAVEAALTVGTAGAGAILKPFLRPTGQFLKGVATSLGGRGAVKTGAALANVAERQAAAASVRADTARRLSGQAQILREGMLYDDQSPITRSTQPKSSGVTRNPPKSSGMVKSPTAETVVSKSAKPKASKAAKPKVAKAPKLTTAKIEAATEKYARGFNKEVGEIEMQATEYTPTMVVEQISKPASTKARQAKPTSVKPLKQETPKQTTKKIEAATEKYAPGFNKQVGKTEMRSTQYEPIEVSTPASPVAEVKTSKPARASRKATQKKSEVAAPQNVSPVSGSKYPRSVKSSDQKQEFDKIYDEMSESGYFDQGHGGLDAIFDSRKFDDVVERGYLTDKQVAKINKDAERMRADSVTREMTARKKTQVAKPKTADVAQPSAEDLEFARKYPYSSKTADILRRQRGIQDYVPPVGKQDFPKIEIKTARVQKPESDIFNERLNAVVAQRRAEQKAAFPGFTPRKVTKLAKRDPSLDRLEERGSMIYRMYDQGIGSRKRPSGMAESEVQRGTPIQNQMDDIADMMQGGTGQFRYAEIAVGSKDVQKEIERTIVLPTAKIKRGEAINPRYVRRTKATKQGEMPMPTLMGEGMEEFRPTRMPLSTERGLSLEQRIAKMEREDFPQARSARQARKLSEQSRGVPVEQQQFTTGTKGGSPLGGAAKKSPITSVTTKKPIKYEKIVKPGGQTVYKPVKFKSETVPAIETTSGPVPIDELPQKWNVDPTVVEAGRKARKASELRSRATQAARLRNRGIQGEARGVTLQQTVEEIKKGKAFQRRFDELKDKK